ncbi:CFEM domain-containing protein [Apiospora arundinis]
MVSVFMASVFTCIPVYKYWYRDVPGHCNIEGLQYIVTSSITVLTDILVLLLPIKIVVGLQMPTRLKVGLMLVLTLGFIVTVISILRLAWLVEYHYGGLFLKPDFSYDIRFVYSTIECNLAIICASIPALSSLLKRWFPRLFAKLTQNGGGGAAQVYPNAFFKRYTGEQQPRYPADHVARDQNLWRQYGCAEGSASQSAGESSSELPALSAASEFGRRK